MTRSRLSFSFLSSTSTSCSPLRKNGWVIWLRHGHRRFLWKVLSFRVGPPFFRRCYCRLGPPSPSLFLPSVSLLPHTLGPRRYSPRPPPVFFLFWPLLPPFHNEQPPLPLRNQTPPPCLFSGSNFPPPFFFCPARPSRACLPFFSDRTPGHAALRLGILLFSCVSDSPPRSPRLLGKGRPPFAGGLRHIAPPFSPPNPPYERTTFLERTEHVLYTTRLRPPIATSRNLEGSDLLPE